jgi:hypothetical protein
MIFLTIGSVVLLVYAANHPGNAAIQQTPIKCSGKCKEANTPVQWNIVSPTFFHTES